MASLYLGLIKRGRAAEVAESAGGWCSLLTGVHFEQISQVAPNCGGLSAGPEALWYF